MGTGRRSGEKFPGHAPRPTLGAPGLPSGSLGAQNTPSHAESSPGLAGSKRGWGLGAHAAERARGRAGGVLAAAWLPGQAPCCVLRQGRGSWHGRKRPAQLTDTHAPIPEMRLVHEAQHRLAFPLSKWRRQTHCTDGEKEAQRRKETCTASAQGANTSTCVGSPDTATATGSWRTQSGTLYGAQCLVRTHHLLECELLTLSGQGAYPNPCSRRGSWGSGEGTRLRAHSQQAGSRDANLAPVPRQRFCKVHGMARPSGHRAHPDAAGLGCSARLPGEQFGKPGPALPSPPMFPELYPGMSVHRWFPFVDVLCPKLSRLTYFAAPRGLRTAARRGKPGSAGSCVDSTEELCPSAAPGDRTESQMGDAFLKVF